MTKTIKYGWLLLLVGTMFQLSAQGFSTTTPYQIEQGKIIIEAHIGGSKGRFILDTAAPTCVTQRFLDNYQQHITPKEKVAFEDSNGKTIQSNIVTLPTIRIGTVNFNTVSTAILPSSNIVSQLGLDGIIGYTLFGHVCLHIDSQQQKIIIAAAIDTTTISQETAIPLIPNPYRLPIINVMLNHSTPHPVMLDVGATPLLTIASDSIPTLTTQNALSIIDTGYGATSIGAGGIEQNNTKYRLGVDTLTIGSIDFTNLRIENTPGSLSRLGTHLLRYGNLAIDYPNQRLYYTPHSQQNFKFQQKDWDVTLTAYDNKLIAGVVWGDLHKHIKAGTQIVAVNGKRFDHIDVQKAITTNLIQLTGDQATITVKDENGEKTYTIYRR